ncbi:hypothetical protein BH23CHL5_BH23CHL5_06590 [soil metagenome]
MRYLERQNRNLGSVAVTSLAILLAASGCTNSGSGQTPASDVSRASFAELTPTVQPTPFKLYVPSPTPLPSPTPTETPIVPPTPIVENSELVSVIDDLLSQEAGVFGVVVLDESGNYLYARNANTPFIAASLYKLVLFADILGRVETGEIGHDDQIWLDPEFFGNDAEDSDSYFLPESQGEETSVETALFAAGAYSSNVSARALMTLTTDERLAEMAQQLGMMDTFFRVDVVDLPLWPERYLGAGTIDTQLAIAFIETQNMNGPVFLTTPSDIARFWFALNQGEVVSSFVSQSILDILREQVVTDRIPALLPDGAVVANKTGNLYHVVHDSGIIDSQGSDLVLATLTQGEPEDNHGAEVIQRIALAVIGETEMPAYSEESGNEEEETISDLVETTDTDD